MREGGGRVVAMLVALVVQTQAQEVTPLVVSPAGRDVELRVGERRGFSASLAAPEARYAWSLDGTASGLGNRFEFRPTATHVGRHEVSVTALAGPVAARHTWIVSVEAVGAPTILRAVPSAAVVRVPADDPSQFELEVEPAALTDQVTVRWTVDGAPAGEGSRLVVRAPAAGAQRVRAVAASAYGGAVMREWQLVASARVVAAKPAPTAPPAPATLPVPAEIVPVPREAPPLKRAKPSREEAVAPVEVARVAPAPEPPPPPPSPSGVSEDDVRALMFRYEQAWRTRNVEELRRIGHVETDEQQAALAKYFATTRDLEVAVHLLELRVDAGRGMVRFTRRDRFHDPAGREVSKESPPIEKIVVRTPQGVRFSPRSS